MKTGHTDLLILSIPKVHFKEFFENDIAILIHSMQMQSQKLFIPIAVSQSIVMPDKEVQITFRNAKNVKNIPLTGWFTEDVRTLAKKFVARQINLPQARLGEDTIQ